MIHTKDQRVRYIRALERFLSSCSSALKSPSFEFSAFEKRAKKSLALLQKVEPVRLDSNYLSQLLAFVTLVSSHLTENNASFEEKHRLLLKEVNRLEKERTAGSYKKSKHTKSDFEDGY